MSRGTSWSIYRVDNEEGPLCIGAAKAGVAAGYAKDYYSLWGTDKDVDVEKAWGLVPDVIHERWLGGGHASRSLNECLEEEDNDTKSVYNRVFYRKEDGKALSLLATWDFISTSMFILQDILDIGLPREKIISKDTAKELLNAIDFCLTAKKTKRDKGEEFAKAIHSIPFVDSLNREGLCPFPSTSGDKDEFMLEEESHLMRLRDILNAFLTICDSEDYPYNAKNEYILTCGYWG